MQLAKWTPRHHLRRQNSFFPGMMDDFFAPFSTGTSTFNGFMPSVDIYEKDDKVHFEAEVPGFNRDDLHVDMEGDIITLSGERKLENEEKGQRYRKERRYGKFSRSFRLSFTADSNSVEAKYENGILTVVVTKPQEQQAKKIQIN